eukprot:TRINITY_DN10639_c0_g1_i1.p1 TRINITY_DN10639_c0_g1~~TRINITY_DN10639_c0_g1_i1.p1  ORF type:complete len:261 (+),score=48.95 TRINITY_DN10639_c0_g1_i1:200-982(+)
MSTAEFKRLENFLRDSTRHATNINKLHDRLSRADFDQSVFDTTTERECQRLAQFYDEAIKSAEDEDKSATKALKIISTEFGLATGGGGGGNKRSRESNFYDAGPPDRSYSAPKARPSMHLGASKSRPAASSDKPKKIFLEGTQVACKIVQFGMEPSWILASVMEYVHATKKYRIKDEDPTEACSPEYLAPWKNVVSLEDERSILPAGEKVLAIYPDSTIFYHATVVKGPAHHDDDYTLFFDGDQSQVRMVNGHYVFSARE